MATGILQRQRIEKNGAKSPEKELNVIGCNGGVGGLRYKQAHKANHIELQCYNQALLVESEKKRDEWETVLCQTYESLIMTAQLY